jgi:AraC-like DNA-binding protein
METILATTGNIIWRWLEHHRIDPVELFVEEGLTKERLSDPSYRVPTKKWDAIRRRAMTKIKRPSAGLGAAKCWHPSDIGVLGYAWLASSTLRTALVRLERYSRLVGQSGTWILSDNSFVLTATHLQTREDPQDRAIAADMHMSIVMEMCRMNYGSDLKANRVRLQRPNPSSHAEDYVDFYGCEIDFSAAEDQLSFSIVDADRKLPSANQELAAIHDQLLIEQLATLDKSDIVGRCQSYILENLTNGEISLNEVAGHLHVSPRTLNRRLESHNTNFTTLLDDTRRQLAERYLSNDRRSITEIAFLLGFQQQSSLTRAAKRWFNRPPRQFREDQRNATY